RTIRIRTRAVVLSVVCSIPSPITSVVMPIFPVAAAAERAMRRETTTADIISAGETLSVLKFPADPPAPSATKASAAAALAPGKDALTREGSLTVHPLGIYRRGRGGRS